MEQIQTNDLGCNMVPYSPGEAGKLQLANLFIKCTVHIWRRQLRGEKSCSAWYNNSSSSVLSGQRYPPSSAWCLSEQPWVQNEDQEGCTLPQLMARLMDTGHLGRSLPPRLLLATHHTNNKC